jgi:hypothetical protein
MTDFSALVLDIERRLRAALPGPPSQLKMVPTPRPGQLAYTEVEGTSLKAGVMVLLYPKAGGAHLAFIRRPATVLHHKNQISFPGGGIEEGVGATAMVLAEFLDVLEKNE